jgi:uncharacterized protein YqcC (DUF446 family)
MTVAQRAGAIADRLRTALAKLGRWSAAPLDPARLVDMGPFGMRTLAAEEWLQYVLVPRLDDVAHDEATLPAGSETAAWATRQLDGDPDAEAIVSVLRDLDELVLGHALITAVAGSSGAAGVLEATPFDIDLATIGTSAPALDAMIAALDAGADPDTRTESTLTALMVATMLDHREAVELLLARGADPDLRDELGRTAERFAVFPMIGHAIRLCRGLAVVEAAYVSQLHAPASHQFTTAMLGLQLSGPMPPDAFEAWPPDAPVIVFVLGDDPTSRLIRLAPPVYQRPTS